MGQCVRAAHHPQSWDALGVSIKDKKGSQMKQSMTVEISSQEAFDEDGSVKATIFQTEGTFTKQKLEQDEDKKPGTWHWPERV
jgi:hypothetical protein